jgi:outer membrane protein assembly factor BamB
MPKLRALNCPSCNAPLDIEEDDRTVKCKFCGTVVEVPQAKPETITPPSIVIHTSTGSAPGSRRAGSIIGAVVVLIVVVSIMGAIIPAILALIGVGAAVSNLPNLPDVQDLIGTAIPTGPRLRVSDALVLPPAGDAPSDVLAVTFNIDDSTYALGYVETISPSVRWQGAPPTNNGFYSLHVLADDELIYMLDKTRLTALRRSDGSTAWQASLVDEIGPSCEGCARLLPGRVIVLTKDGTVQAFDTGSGRAVWSARLEATPDRLFSAGGFVVAVDARDSAGMFKVFDPATGALLHTIEPSAPNEPFPDDAQEMQLYSPAVADEAGGALYTVLGIFPPTTFQKWDAATGQLIWQTEAKRDEVQTPSSSLEPALLSDGLYMNDREQIVAVSADGAFRRLPGDDDYELFPLMAQGEVLVVRARRTRGSERFEVWGLNSQTGERLWQYVPEAQQYGDDERNDFRLFVSQTSSGAAPAESAGVWTWRAGSDFILVQAFSEQGRVVVERLSITDGVSQGQVALRLKLSDSLIITGELVRLTNRQAWLIVDGQVQAFDLETGELQYVWP